MKHNPMDRRTFIKTGVTASAAVGLLPLLSFTPKARAEEVDPHFFVCVFLPQGADWSYLFDARPLEMTAAGLKQNYLAEEPMPWESMSGKGKTLVTSLAKPLEGFRSDLAILNGVYMSLTFNGHDQNTNLFLSGNAFGGDSFIPTLNQYVKTKSDLDSIMMGRLFADQKNLSNSLSISPETWIAMHKNMGSSPSLDLGTPLMKFVGERISENAKGSGLFSFGVSQMMNGFVGANDFYNKMRKVTINADAKTEIEKAFDVVKEAIRVNLCRGFLLSLDRDLDAHAPTTAQRMPESFKKIAEDLAQLIKLFKDTPYDDKRSYFDVTTLCITSEFSRTFRQQGVKISETGTDHNTFSNTFVLAGKGIKGGVIGGGSDYQTSKEELSPLHKKIDKDLLMHAGRPCDLKTLEPHDVWPDEFDEEKFLCCGHIVNTILKEFGAPDTHLRKMKNGSPFASIEGFLKT